MLDRPEVPETDSVTTPVDELRPIKHLRVSAAMRRGKERSWRSALECAVNKAERYDAYMKQHGPVKILMKDGKPVDQS